MPRFHLPLIEPDVQISRITAHKGVIWLCESIGPVVVAVNVPGTGETVLVTVP